MTYLEMCQKFVRETMQGTLTTTVSQTGLYLKMVDWIADADEQICSMFLDWDFLWTEFTDNTIVGTATVNKPSDLGIWDTDSFYLDRTASTYKKLIPMDYKQWRTSYRNGTKTNAKPSFFIIKPDKNLVLETPPDAVYSLTADYWKTPTRLSGNTDESLIPDRFQRIVIERAKMFFATDQEDPELFQLSNLEYTRLLGDLEADQLPGRSPTRKGSNEDLVITVV